MGADLPGAQALPAARIGREGVTGAHVPLHPHTPGRQVEHLHVDAGLGGAEVGLGTEMGRTVLPLHRVVGLTAVDPAAVHADAHPGQAAPGAHCGGQSAG